VATRSGAVTRYAVTDPLLKDLLAIAKQILNRRLVDAQGLLRELKRDVSTRPVKVRDVHSGTVAARSSRWARL
jgi:hypothetical protein